MEKEKKKEGQTFLVPIEQELTTSYLRYAMSVIVSRALPDVRDGLKPVHRRILYAMHSMGLRAHLPFKKCGRIVGDVLGKFHPHGEQSIYDALARLGQDFSMRYPLIDGQGNFGSIDGDSPAAMRYTEARLSALAELFLSDIDKGTVEFAPNYDDSLEEPSVLPSILPNLLVNGTNGIAVGMATNIPAHNLREISNAICAIVENEHLTEDELFSFVKGPDFPTGGVIHGASGIKQAYRTGKGHLVLRAKIDFEEKGSKRMLVVTEIPYQIRKSDLLQQIAKQIQDKNIEGVVDIRDESDRRGMRVLFFLKNHANVNIVLNQLYKSSDLQTTVGFYALAIVNGSPQTLPLVEMILQFIRHRREVITRRTAFDLKKSKAKEHILLGFVRALEAIDEVIRIIRKAKNVQDAQHELCTWLQLSEKQGKAILDMKLYRLNSMEVQNIRIQLADIQKHIKNLENILSHKKEIDAIIIKETRQMAERFGDDRRTLIVHDEVEFLDRGELLQKQVVVITISGGGYIKRVLLKQYRTQSRGGKGSSSSRSLLRSDDYIAHMIVGSTHDYVLFTTSLGRSFWIKGYDIPEAGRNAKGTHISMLFPFKQDEKLASMVMLSAYDDETFLFFATRYGIVKRLPTSALKNAKRRGTISINLQPGDSLVDAFSVTEEEDFFLVSQRGKGLRFPVHQVRPSGKVARGVRGMRLKKNDSMMAACAVRKDSEILLVTEKGYGKRMYARECMAHNRGTGGQTVYRIEEERTGKLINVMTVSPDDTCMLIAESGNTVRFRIGDVAIQKRNTMGVCLMKIGVGNKIRAVSCTSMDTILS
ncbi:hypothetical protein LSH36_583g02007 [Paralvinella palmiformis]|uniref:DNA topoisomerase (ATP-hydrolyzing) n=1 Tax=Paralvinella palmiformis TaxID=53620 RepID=A0AAD9MV00_9ANNE|nr:hypothetical protein LSH36_583g02007 [Paralvinella palmiformis]